MAPHPWLGRRGRERSTSRRRPSGAARSPRAIRATGSRRAAWATSSGSISPPARGCLRAAYARIAGSPAARPAIGVSVRPGHDVHPDPLGQVGRGHRRHQRGEGALRGRVRVGREVLRDRVAGGDPAEEQDRAARPRSVRLLVAHPRDDRARDEGLAREVQLERPIPGVAGHAVDGPIAEPPAAAHLRREEPVDPPELLDWPRRRPVDRRLVAAPRPPIQPPPGAATSCQRRGRDCIRDTTKTAAPSAAARSAVAAAIPVDPVTRTTRPASRPVTTSPR